MSAVQHEPATGARPDVKPARPARPRQALADRALVDVERAGGRHGQQRVAGLVGAEQPDAEIVELEGRSGAVQALAGQRPLAHRDPELVAFPQQRHADGGGTRGDDGRRLGRLGGGDRDAGADDVGLVGRDLPQRVAEVLLVVEVDRREDADGRRADGGRVVATAQTDLQHRHLDALAREVVERQRGRRLEHAGVEARDQGAQRLHAVGQRVLADRLGIHANALAERHQVGRRVEPDPAAGGAQHGGQHGGHRPLAVGAADLRDRVGPLGMAERVQQGLDPLEPGAHPGMLAAAEGEEPGQRLGVRHAGGVGWSAKKASRRRSVSLSSRRSTMRSS